MRNPSDVEMVGILEKDMNGLLNFGSESVVYVKPITAPSGEKVFGMYYANGTMADVRSSVELIEHIAHSNGFEMMRVN